ncbi:hypothetical protein CHS0354_034898 [Potamilus streckersoni]|uniref:Uncharacterized protein n=1 Tax=Potamilus streckersoni TaxID=2493646 RepID=A0AAE0VQV9_9BIVA|nr:hypothetical protein CHS0354_034898 [Potamilus streckersoni]
MANTFGQEHYQNNERRAARISYQMACYCIDTDAISKRRLADVGMLKEAQALCLPGNDFEPRHGCRERVLFSKTGTTKVPIDYVNCENWCKCKKVVIVTALAILGPNTRVHHDSFDEYNGYITHFTQNKNKEYVK